MTSSGIVLSAAMVRFFVKSLGAGVKEGISNGRGEGQGRCLSE